LWWQRRGRQWRFVRSVLRRQQGRADGRRPHQHLHRHKYLQDGDYTASAWLTFRRFYNSTTAVAYVDMGTHWRHSFDRSLEILGTPAVSIVMFRPDGRRRRDRQQRWGNPSCDSKQLTHFRQ
jgi:hypothetical protein